MKYSEIQLKGQHELQEMLDELKVKLGKYRFELADKSLKDFSQIKKAKKDIARVLTALRNANLQIHANATNNKT